jgi:hypothetical protein
MLKIVVYILSGIGTGIMFYHIRLLKFTTLSVNKTSDYIVTGNPRLSEKIIVLNVSGSELVHSFCMVRVG